jgi:hypothetical protein
VASLTVIVKMWSDLNTVPGMPSKDVLISRIIAGQPQTELESAGRYAHVAWKKATTVRGLDKEVVADAIYQLILCFMLIL